MDCLYAQCARTSPTRQRSQKLGRSTRGASRREGPRFVRLPCTHFGTYADDCICRRVRQHKCYIVATCDTDLKRRIRKIGVPIMAAAAQVHRRAPAVSRRGERAQPVTATRSRGKRSRPTRGERVASACLCSPRERVLKTYYYNRRHAFDQGRDVAPRYAYSLENETGPPCPRGRSVASAAPFFFSRRSRSFR